MSESYPRCRCPVCGHWLDGADGYGWVCSRRGGCGSEWPAETLDEKVELRPLRLRPSEVDLIRSALAERAVAEQLAGRDEHAHRALDLAQDLDRRTA